jgi:thiol-disulfide isomerase/thioredoxin
VLKLEKNRRLVTASVAALAIFLSACGAADAASETEPVNETEAASENSDKVWSSRKINTSNLNGETVTNETFTENKLTMLNVWATWCPPCVRELPELQKISEAYAAKGVGVVGVLQDGVTELGAPDEKTIETAKKLLAEVNYIVILPDETLTTEFINQMAYFPTTFFLDSNGEVIRTVIGSRDFDGWKAEIDEILGEV